MYRKMNIRRLILLVVILLLVVGGLTLKEYFKGERSYRTNVMTIDTAQVTSITISSAIPYSNTIKLYLDQKQWKARGNGNTYSADPGIMKNLITDLAQLKIEALAGTSRNNWSEFQVNDSSAIKVSIEEKGKKKKKILFIGKFSYQQPSNQYERQGKMSTFVRLAGEDETYSVQGFLRMNFAPDINNYRNKFLLKSNSELFSKLTFTYPDDSSFILTKDNKKWLIDGIPVDSSKLDSYFADLERLSSYEFADTIKHNPQSFLTLKIEGPTLPSPLELNALLALSGSGYLIHSSYNPEALFNGSSQNLASKIFKGKKSFLK
jgi:hypothetical protein